MTYLINFLTIFSILGVFTSLLLFYAVYDARDLPETKTAKAIGTHSDGMGYIRSTILLILSIAWLTARYVIS